MSLAAWKNLLLQKMYRSEQMRKKDAIEALVALGYSASEAAGAVRKLQVTEEMSVEDVLKLSLKKSVKE